MEKHINALNASSKRKTECLGDIRLARIRSLMDQYPGWERSEMQKKFHEGFLQAVALHIYREDADVDMDAIIGHIKTYNLTETELSALTQVEQDSDAVPKLFLMLFAMWLAPELGLTEGALPRRCEPFVKALPTLCMDMLEGRIVTLQSFVNRAVADYIMGPRAAN